MYVHVEWLAPACPWAGHAARAPAAAAAGGDELRVRRPTQRPATHLLVAGPRRSLVHGPRRVDLTGGR